MASPPPSRRDLLLGFLGAGALGACGGAPHTEEEARRARPRPALPTLPLAMWLRLGPGGGGATYLPTVSPVDPERVVVTSDMTGTFVTTDGGVYWHVVNLRGRARAFAWDPVERDTLYAAAIGLFRTRDAGATWSLVLPDPATVRGVAARGDHADEELVVDGPTRLVTAIAVDPSGGEGLALGVTSDPRDHRVFRSHDGGRTLEELAIATAPVLKIAIDPRSPRGARRVVAVTREEVIVFDGQSALRSRVPAAELEDAAIVFLEDEPARVYACAKGGSLLVSQNGGQSFTPCDVGRGEASNVRAVAATSASPHVAYASFSDLGGSAQGGFGVARTVDGGRSFQPVWLEHRAASPAVDDGWVSERFGPAWGENPLCLGVAPSDARRVYTTDLGRVLRTRDGGRVFRAVYTHRSYYGGYTTTGLDVTTAHALAFDPHAPRVLFAAMTDVGLFRSEDGGVTWWSATSQGVPRAWVNTTYSVAFDPDERDRLYAAMSDTHDLPRPKVWRDRSASAGDRAASTQNRAIASFAGGVCVSRDRGLSFRPLDGLPSCAAVHVLAAAGRLVVVAGFGRGVFVSRDAGASFADASLGLPDEPLAYRVGLAADAALWVLTVRRTEDARPGSAEAGALYRAETPGARFVRIELPRDVAAPNGFALDPGDARVVLVAAWHRDADERSGGVLVSRDGGATWSASSIRERYAFDVTLDPRVPGRVYAAGFSSQVHRSDDGGATFQPIEGFDFKWAQRVVLDPRDPSRIWVCTFGGGIWTGPAAGASASTRVDLGGPLRL